MDDQLIVRHTPLFQRLIAGDDQLVRIDELPLLSDTEIEMGAGRRSRRPHIADGLPLPYPFAVFHVFGKTGHMPVERLQPVVVADNDLFAVASGPPDLGNDPVAYGHNGGSGGGAVINALMGPGVAEDRMPARHAVTRCHAQERERGFEQFPVEVVAFRIVVCFPAAFVVEQIGRIQFVLIGEFCTEHAPIPLKRIMAETLFHQNLEGIAFPQIADEIDFGSEDLRKGNSQGYTFALLGHGFGECAFDPAFDDRQ